MKKSLYIFGLITIMLFTFSCINDSPSSSSDSGYDESKSSSSGTLSQDLIDNYTTLLEGEGFNVSDIISISNNAKDKFTTDGLTNSDDISLLGQAFLKSIETESLNSSSASANQSGEVLSVSLTPAYKIRAIELAVETLIKALPGNIENISSNSSDINLATTSYNYSFVLQIFTDLAIGNLDEAGIVTDYISIAVQGIMQTVSSNLINGGLTVDDIPGIIEETTQAAMGAIMETGVTSAEVPAIAQKMIYGTILGTRSLQMGDAYVGSITTDILKGVCSGMEEASITGAFQELVVKGIKDGLDDGIAILSELSESQKQAVYDDIQAEATTSGSDLALFDTERIETVEIVLDRNTAPKGAYISFSIRGYYYASDGYVDLNDDPDMHLYITPYFTQSGSNLIASIPGTGTMTAIYGTFSKTETITVTEAEIIGIEILPRFTSLPLGQVIDFNVTATYSDGVTSDVSASSAWGVNKTSNTTLSPTGDFRTTEYGDIEIVVSNGSFNDNLSFSISDAVLDTLDISPKDTSLPLGLSEQYTVTGTFTDDSQTVINDGLVWINASFDGVATGITEGVHIVSVSQGDVTTNTTLTVTPKQLHRLVIFPEDFELAKGEERRYTATGVYTNDTLSDKTNLVTWEVSHQELAIIGDFRTPGDNGLLETMQTELVITNPLDTTVTATCDSDCADDLYESITLVESTLLTVNKQVLTNIDITVPQADFYKGQSMQLSASGDYTDNTTIDITSSVDCAWSSSDEYYAVITAAGVVRAEDVGSVVITLDCDVMAQTLDLDVQAAKLVSIAITPEVATVKVDDVATQQYTAIGVYTDESSLNITDSVLWDTSDDSISAIDSAGLASGIDEYGTSIVTAFLDGVYSNSVQLRVDSASETVYCTGSDEWFHRDSFKYSNKQERERYFNYNSIDTTTITCYPVLSPKYDYVLIAEENLDDSCTNTDMGYGYRIAQTWERIDNSTFYYISIYYCAVPL